MTAFLSQMGGTPPKPPLRAEFYGFAKFSPPPLGEVAGARQVGAADNYSLFILHFSLFTKSNQQQVTANENVDGNIPQMQTLASPERGGAPKGRRGCLPLESRRRWRRGLSHLTVRTVPKYVRCAHCFGTGAAKSIHSPNFMLI